jgi:hypothetical protein
MNAFPLRRHTRMLAVAVAAVAAFSLTACGDDETAEGGSAGQAGNESPSGQDGTAGGAGDTVSNGDANEQNEQNEQGGENGQNEESDESDESEENGAEPGQGTGGGGDGQSEEDTDIATCTDANTEVTVSAVERPINHLLLTATNTGDEACFAYHAPFLGFDEAQAPLPFIEDSRPQSVTTLEPGQSADAGVTTSSGASQDGDTMTSLTLHFAPAGGRGSVGGPVDLPLPGGEAYVDDSAAVTYWLSSLDDALMW